MNTLLASVYQGKAPGDWDLFVVRSSQEGMAPFFFRHLKSFPSGFIPSPHLETLKQLFLVSAGHHLTLEQALLKILNQFAAQGIDCLVLKGMALAYLTYPDPADRTMVDIDLFVRSGDLRRATEVLASLGYRTAGQYQTYQEELIRFGGELAFQRPQGPLVELHWMMEQYERLRGLIRIDEDALWRRAISYPINGIQVKTLFSTRIPSCQRSRKTNCPTTVREPQTGLTSSPGGSGVSKVFRESQRTWQTSR